MRPALTLVVSPDLAPQPEDFTRDKITTNLLSAKSRCAFCEACSEPRPSIAMPARSVSRGAFVSCPLALRSFLLWYRLLLYLLDLVLYICLSSPAYQVQPAPFRCQKPSLSSEPFPRV